MDRRWIMGLVGLALTGCVSSKPENPAFKPPVSEGSPFAALPPIDQTINRGMPGPSPTQLARESTTPKASASSVNPGPLASQPLRDPGTQRTSIPDPLPTLPPTSPPAREAAPMLPEPAPLPMNLPEAGARPAPFAQAKVTSPRPQARPEAESGARPAPFVNQQPSAPRPQAAPIATPAARATALPELPAPNQAAPPEMAPTPLPSEPPRLETLPALPPSAGAQPEPMPLPLPSSVAPPTLSTTSPSAPPTLPPTDSAIARTTGDGRAKKPKDELSIVGRPAARVGDEIITLHQLRTALRERLDTIPPEQRASMTAEDQRRAADAILSNLIERALILQAAKRQLKEPKQIQMFYEGIEKFWLEHEIPPLLKQHGAANLADLKIKLEEKGKSYEYLHEEFRQNTLAQEYLMMRMKDKMTISLPEMYSYYDKHLKDYDRPAQIIWREIVIDLSKYPNRAAAKAKADEILARLMRNEDFVTLAKRESQGPTAAQGGKWETTPGSYGIPSVNDALNRLPVNQISPVIEAPQTFHIVRVEERRNAGPARFDEVQHKVRASVMESKRAGAAAKFVASLREKTLITTMFDAPTSDPSAMRVSAPGR